MHESGVRRESAGKTKSRLINAAARNPWLSIAVAVAGWHSGRPARTHRRT